MNNGHMAEIPAPQEKQSKGRPKLLAGKPAFSFIPNASFLLCLFPFPVVRPREDRP
jgi:hypothetical protein